MILCVTCEGIFTAILAANKLWVIDLHRVNRASSLMAGLYYLPL